MDPLQGCMFPKVWTVPTWEFAEDMTLAPYVIAQFVARKKAIRLKAKLA
jgi:hypothetical protein